jgi:hypothetical protein
MKIPHDFGPALFLRFSVLNFQLRFPHISQHSRDRNPTYESGRALKLALIKERNEIDFPFVTRVLAMPETLTYDSPICHMRHK